MAKLNDETPDAAVDGWITEVPAWHILAPVATDRLLGTMLIVSSFSFLVICIGSACARLSAKRISRRMQHDLTDLQWPLATHTGKNPLVSRLFQFKMSVLLTFIVLCIVRFFLTVISGLWHTELVVADCLEICCLVMALFKTLHYQRRHIPSSGSLFTLFFLLSLCHSARFYSMMVRLNAADQKDVFLADATTARRLIYVELSLLMLSYALLVSNCFADIYGGKTHADSKQSPLSTISFPSFVTFSWVFMLVYNGWCRSLTFADLWHLPDEFRTCNTSQLFEFCWAFEQKRTKNRSPSLSRALYRMIAYQLWFGAVLRLLVVGIMFCSPVVLKLLLHSVISADETSAMPIWKSFAYAFALFVIAILSSIGQNHFFRIQFEFGTTFRSALTMAVYKKLYRLSNTARRSWTAGELINLISVDVQRIVDMASYTFVFVMVPSAITLSLFLLWRELGPSVNTAEKFMYFVVFKDKPIHNVFCSANYMQSLVGIAVLLIFLPLNAATGALQHRFYFSQIQWKDKRMAFMSEILNGIKVLKLYAWERPFMQRVMQCRQQEVRRLRQQSLLDVVGSVAWEMTPLIMAIACFAGHVLWTSDESSPLTAERMFVSMALFQMLTVPVGIIPHTITTLVQCRVALKRLTRFLTSEEAAGLSGFDLLRTGQCGDARITKNGIIQDDAKPPPAVRIRNGTFSWGRDESVIENAILHDIDLDLPVGSLTAVVGVVGAGKSSLCSAVLGLMDKSSSTAVQVCGRLAYAPQQPWIRNASLKQNILFSTDTDDFDDTKQSLDVEKYERVLDACALRADLDVLPAGDATEIGEKGVNLSGGQKQRVSLARAAYNDADVYILDDPLSAVDAHVANHLFDKLVGNENGLLRRKTRLLVTHSLSVLPHVDMIIVLDNGRIVERGTYKQLREAGRLAQVIASLAESKNEKQAVERLASTESSDKQSFHTALSRASSQFSHRRRLTSENEDADVKADLLSDSFELKPAVESRTAENSCSSTVVIHANNKNLIEEEEAQIGNVSGKVYLLYAQLMSYKLCAICLAAFVSYEAFIVLSQLWLARWAARADAFSANSTLFDGPPDFFAWQKQQIAVYAGLGGIIAVFFALSCVMLTVCTVRAMHRLHARMLDRIMHAPMQFFDTTPIGRIVNRFSRDIDAIDNEVPQKIRPLLQIAMQLFGILFLISYSTPIFIAVGVVLFVAFIFIQRFYVCTSRQLKRIESLKKSPIFSHFSETIQGMAVIKAMQKQHEFERQFEKLVDEANVPFFYWFYADRWVFLALSTLSAIVVLFASLLVLLARHYASSWATPSMMGLVISNALSFAAPMQWFVRYLSDLESNIVSVERVKYYMDNVPQEAAWESDVVRLREHWPEEGQIKFEKFSTRYRRDLPLALDQIDFRVRSREKIGIAGRTGAGKSSLTLALFRIIEASSSGRIEIDGVDISRLGLHDLRKRLTVIPQESVLFRGTLRFNIDPEQIHTDDAVFEALHHAHLRQWVENLAQTSRNNENGLNFVVAEDGQNLSVGQRQLVCLARALLRRPRRVLVLDEATAAVDAETDELIQQTIRREFKDATVLTIAHRLHTILDCDRVMVVGDGGKLLEFDRPVVLLENERSELSRLVRAAAFGTHKSA